ncbi:nucleolar protein 8 [Tachyglossus aculeatus]|uniref:nucleolar protein 8 n=1 Tax=Tachyglossus aculeatus TaxID=9261 RepID=UPI0018F38E69|nr:nucleolar protein 8 [Tachyglossus aculeatus]XP_038628669.1 nucleolar protein 8 [Tachyglossus aculeatus]
METEKATKRLYVGGLSQTISQADLQHQFCRFGDVSDVEMITRKDDQGNPTKTFAYINIKTTDVELKRCMSLLNKTKWKGGTLQIEMAKESFLHRLAQERLEAKVKKEKPSRVQHADRLESLRKAGVVDFQLKAVPGTEIPDNKDWVVSKFGRVLPVLHLRSQTRRKIIKYDPSNYCHNLKRLEQVFTDTVPIDSLTWQLEGGDDPMSKKRRGEFPVFHNQYQKKAKIGGSKDSNSILAQGPDLLVTNQNLMQEKSIQKTHFKSNGLPKLLQIPNNKSEKRVLQTSASEPLTKINGMTDEDFDSEEEFRAALVREKSLKTVTPNAEPEDDPLEIVSEHFELKLSTHWSLANSDIKKNAFCGGKDKDVDDNSDCDSADTDEIIATKKNPSKSGDNQDYSKSKSKPGPEERLVSKNIPKHKSSASLSVSKAKSLHFKGQSDNTKSQSVSSRSESDSETSDSDGDTDYEAMMQNCYRLDLTLEDLEKLASGDLKSSGEDTQSKSSRTTNRGVKVDEKRNGKASKPSPKPSKCINPEDIVASILEGEENISDDQAPKQSIAESKFQAFKGIGSLYQDKTLEKHCRETTAAPKRKKDLTSASTARSGTVPKEDGSSSSDVSSDGEVVDCQPHVTEARSMKGTQVGPGKLQKRKTSLASRAPVVPSPPSSLENESGSADSRFPPFRGIKSASPRPGTGIRDEDAGSHNQPGLADSEEDNRDACVSVISTVQRSQEVTILKTPGKKLAEDSIKKGSTASAVLSHGMKAKPLESTADFILPVNAACVAEAKDQHLQDNQKRLAAIQERQKEREIQKQLIQGALSSLDGKVESKSTHIVFNSDGESEAEEKLSNEDHEWTKEFKSKTSGKLFESSEDEGDESEDDGDRFKIKPQFEGKAGQKLMNLQSRFGTDDRFRMDSKFLESDSEEEDAEEIKKETTAEEEELAEEKKKNLDVLRSILHIDLQTPKSSKQALAAKEFKDMNSVRYDPTKPDHVTFEKKVDSASKESKAKRKKNRIEAEKLPEVSKEIYYDVAADLKDLFGSAKCSVEKPEKIPWDKNEIKDSNEADPKLLAQNNVEEESAGFTFSFFGPDTEEVKESKEDSYKVETIKPGKAAWQEDPRFQDSSSEEEEEEEEEQQQLQKVDGEQPSLGLPSLSERQTSRFFFFSRDDERLRVGSESFWRKSECHESRDAWEARSSALLVECRKKHKDARRKVKAKH